jgi:hypothetical protein
MGKKHRINKVIAPIWLGERSQVHPVFKREGLGFRNNQLIYKEDLWQKRYQQMCKVGYDYAYIGTGGILVILDDKEFTKEIDLQVGTRLDLSDFYQIKLWRPEWTQLIQKMKRRPKGLEKKEIKQDVLALGGGGTWKKVKESREDMYLEQFQQGLRLRHPKKLRKNNQDAKRNIQESYEEILAQFLIQFDFIFCSNPYQDSWKTLKPVVDRMQLPTLAFVKETEDPSNFTYTLPLPNFRLRTQEPLMDTFLTSCELGLNYLAVESFEYADLPIEDWEE